MGEAMVYFNGEPWDIKVMVPWYMMYCIYNSTDLGPNYAGHHEPPKVVIRQTGRSLLTFKVRRVMR